jgi:drug/metabolite transporter (DMT)-like permease
MAMNGLGIAAGIATAMLWTATAVCFEASSRRLGSWSVNVLRLAVAALLFLALSLLRTQALLPRQLTAAMWRDLALSGLIGFVVGDVMLFEAFVLIGARLSMLIYASVPAMTAVAGYLLLGEVIAPLGLLGMAVTIAGIALAILSNQRKGAPVAKGHARRGVLLAIGGSAGQAAGLLLGKRGSVGLDSFAATEIRALAGLAGFVVLSLATKRLASVASPLWQAMRSTQQLGEQGRQTIRSQRLALGLMLIGAVLGPFLGVSLGLLSVQRLPAGVASTLMSIVPVLLVPVSATLFHECVTWREVAGTVIALIGVAILAF